MYLFIRLFYHQVREIREHYRILPRWPQCECSSVRGWGRKVTNSRSSGSVGGLGSENVDFVGRFRHAAWL